MPINLHNQIGSSCGLTEPLYKFLFPGHGFAKVLEVLYFSDISNSPSHQVLKGSHDFISSSLSDNPSIFSTSLSFKFILIPLAIREIST